MKGWRAPEGWQKITTIDAHTAGEPFRVVTSGFPAVTGATILDKRRYIREKYDHLRTALMLEPRGHADMYGCLVTPPVTAGADFGVLFMHNEGYSTMCGHGIIAMATVALECDMVSMQAPLTTLRIDTPAGLVSASAHIEESRVRRVSFQNVPSFVVGLDQVVDVPGLGPVRYDLAFGGAFYAYVRAADVGLQVAPDNLHELIATGMAIKRAVIASRTVPHPFEEDLSFLYGTIFIDEPKSEAAHSSNVCIFAAGEVDRSPTGTGVSGRLAIHHARGEIRVGDEIIIESIIGTSFCCRAVEETMFGSHLAIVPEVKGSAYITGRHEFLIDPDDPLKNGFVMR
jgi:trans-L-3-hydroxyproline dehydratase